MEPALPRRSYSSIGTTPGTWRVCISGLAVLGKGLRGVIPGPLHGWCFTIGGGCAWRRRDLRYLVPWTRFYAEKSGVASPYWPKPGVRAETGGWKTDFDLRRVCAICGSMPSSSSGWGVGLEIGLGDGAPGAIFAKASSADASPINYTPAHDVGGCEGRRGWRGRGLLGWRIAAINWLGAQLD